MKRKKPERKKGKGNIGVNGPTLVPFKIQDSQQFCSVHLILRTFVFYWKEENRLEVGLSLAIWVLRVTSRLEKYRQHQQGAISRARSYLDPDKKNL